MRGTPCLRDSGGNKERSGRACVDRADALQRLRRLPARLHLRGNRLVNHTPQADEPNERVAALRACEDTPAEPNSKLKREAMVTAWG